MNNSRIPHRKIFMEQAAPTASEKPHPLAARTTPAAANERSKSNSLWLRLSISLILIIASLVVAVLVFVKLTNLKQAPPREEPAVRVLRIEAFVTEATDLRRFLSGFGTARADREVVVSAEVAGRVTETVQLRVGNEVYGPRVNLDADGKSQRRTADVLVQIDPQRYEERLDQVQALITQDEVAKELLDAEHATNQQLVEQQKRRMETIQREYDRREKLLSQGAGAETELERARLELEQYRETQIRLEKEVALYPIRQQELQARLNSHRNDLNLAELDLEKATVRAPFQGQLSAVSVEEGQYVRPGDPLVRITDLTKMEVPIPLSLAAAEDVERLLKSGAKVPVELARSEEDFSRDDRQVWRGELKRLAPTGDERTRTILVFVEVQNDEQTVPLRPGTFVFARIQAGTINRSRGVLIPRDTIVDGQVFLAAPAEKRPSTGDSVQAPEKAISRAVVVGETFQTFALITSGLEPGDKVVMTNLDIIQPGSFLQVQQQHTLAEEFLRLKVPYVRPITLPVEDSAGR